MGFAIKHHILWSNDSRHHPDRAVVKVSRLSNSIPNKTAQKLECNGMVSFQTYKTKNCILT